jgi:hypothetical protein
MKSRNFNAQKIEIVAPTVAGTAFTVSHLCGVQPHGLIITRRNSAAQLYFTPSTWTSTLATLTCDTANANLTVLFFA